MPAKMSDLELLKGPPPDYEATTNFSQPSQSTSTPPQFTCFSLSAYDCIRLIGFSEADVSAIHALVRDTWAKGINSIYHLAGAREIKLNGMPWIPNLKGDDESRNLILGIVEKLYELGWDSCASVRFTLRLSVDKGTFALFKSPHTASNLT